MENCKDLYLFSGPSGAGKTALRLYFCTQFDHVGGVLIATTRMPREKDDGEIEAHGEDYLFLTEDGFKQMEFIEQNPDVHEHRYGTPLKSVLSVIRDFEMGYWILDVGGVETIHDKFGNDFRHEESELGARLYNIFLLPSYEDCRIRLLARGNRGEEYELRLANAEKEVRFIKEAGLFTHLVSTSLPFSETIKRVEAIMVREAMRHRLEECDSIGCEYLRASTFPRSDCKSMDRLVEECLLTDSRRAEFSVETWKNGIFKLS